MIWLLLEDILDFLKNLLENLLQRATIHTSYGHSQTRRPSSRWSLSQTSIPIYLYLFLYSFTTCALGWSILFLGIPRLKECYQYQHSILTSPKYPDHQLWPKKNCSTGILHCLIRTCHSCCGMTIHQRWIFLELFSAIPKECRDDWLHVHHALCGWMNWKLQDWLFCHLEWRWLRKVDHSLVSFDTRCKKIFTSFVRNYDAQFSQLAWS